MGCCGVDGGDGGDVCDMGDEGRFSANCFFCCNFEQIAICYRNRKSCTASNCVKGFLFLAGPVQRQPVAHGVNPCPTSLPSIDGRTASTILGNIIFRLTVKSYLMSQVPSSLKSMKT